MAMNDYQDPYSPFGDSASQPAPGQTDTTYSNVTDPKAQIATWYQQYLGRKPSTIEVDTWLAQHQGDLGAIEDGIRNSPEGQSYALKNSSKGQTNSGNPQTDLQIDQVRQWYQQYLGRDATKPEVDHWLADYGNAEAGIKGSPEAQQFAVTHKPGTTAMGPDGTTVGQASPGTGTSGSGSSGSGSSGSGTTGGGGMNAFRDLWLASGGRTVTDLQNFVKAHPEFGVTLGGTKGDKVYGPGGVFWADAVLSAGVNGGQGAAWQTGTGSSGSGSSGAAAGTPTPVDPSFLGEYPGGPFTGVPGTDQEKLPDYVPFKGITAADVTADPSYAFRRDDALGALENTASGRGLLHSGGTLYDLLGTASQFASTEFGNVYDRAFKTWDENFNDAYKTTTQHNAANTETYNQGRDRYNQSVTDWENSRNDDWLHLYGLGQLGSNATTAP
jgi:uncharacterized protein YbcI